MGTDMLAVTDAGLFKAQMNQKDAEERPGAQASVDLPLYDCFKEFYSAMQKMRGRGWFLLQNPRFQEMLNLDLDCMNNKRLNMETEISELIQGSAKRVKTVLHEENEKLKKIIEKHLRVVNEALATQMSGHKVEDDVKQALAELDRMEQEITKLEVEQVKHRANYKKDLVALLESKREPEVDPAHGDEILVVRKLKTTPLLVEPVSEVRSKKMVVVKPPETTISQPDVEIQGSAKPAKPKPKPSIQVSRL